MELCAAIPSSAPGSRCSPTPAESPCPPAGCAWGEPSWSGGRGQGVWADGGLGASRLATRSRRPT